MGGRGIRVDALGTREGVDRKIGAKAFDQSIVETFDALQLVEGEEGPVRGPLGRVPVLVDVVLGAAALTEVVFVDVVDERGCVPSPLL